jgi:hypothetical protein
MKKHILFKTLEMCVVRTWMAKQLANTRSPKSSISLNCPTFGLRKKSFSFINKICDQRTRQ